MKRLYISDLDQTLYDKNGNLTPSSKTKIKRIVDYGINFTIASARSIRSIQPQFKGIRLSLPIIEFNGAFISDLTTGERHCSNTIDNSIVTEILSLGNKRGLDPFLSTIKNGTLDKLYFPQLGRNPGSDWYINDRVRCNDPRIQKQKFKEAVLHEEQVVCLTFIDGSDRLTDFHNFLTSQYSKRDMLRTHFTENSYSPEWFWLTVHDVQSQKHVAIRTLMQLYNLSDAELVVFGDNINDVEMFQIANRCYAVENALNELKSIATGVIGHHADEPVLDFIMHENEVK